MPITPLPLLKMRFIRASAPLLLAAGLALGAGSALRAQSDLEAAREQAQKGVPGALTVLGSAYASGQGVPQDNAKALQYFRQAAAAHDALAEYNLGLMYEAGQGVPVDLPGAVSFYLQAAKQGIPQAQFNLANMYADGRGVAPDLFEAALWYRQAAEKGLPEAQFNLGLAYELGRGIGQNADQARTWYHAADAQGFTKARLRLAALAQPGAGGGPAALGIPVGPAAPDDRVAALETELAKVRLDNAHSLEALQHEKANLEVRLQVAEGAMKNAMSAPAASDLQGRLTSLEADNANLTREIKRSIIQLSRLTGQLSAAQQALAAKPPAKSAAADGAPGDGADSAKIAELTQELAAARAAAQALEGDKTALGARVAQLTAKAAAAPAPVPATDPLVKQLQQDAAQRQQDLVAAQRDTQRLQAELAAAHVTAAALADDKAALEARLTQLAAKASPSPAPESDALIRQLRQNAAQKQTELDAAQRDALRLRSELQVARATAEALAGVRTALETRVSQLAAKAAAAPAPAAPAPDSDALVKQLRQEAAQKQQDLVAAQRDAERLRTELEAARQKFDVRARELATQVEQARSEGAASAVGSGQASAVRLAAQVDAAGKVIADLNTRNNALQHDLDGMKASAGRAPVATGFSAAAAAASQLALQTLGEQLRVTTLQRDEDRKGFNERLGALETALKESQEANRALTAANQAVLTAKTADDLAQKSELAISLKALTADNQKLTLQLQDLISSRDRAQADQAASLRTLAAETQKLQAQAQELARLQQQDAAMSARLRLAQNALEQISVAARALSSTTSAP